MSKIRYAYPKYKVYIFGHDVTKDVVSINVTANDSEETNICQIELVNELDKYIITTQDMAQLSRFDTKVGKINIPWMTGSGSRGDTEYIKSGVFSPGDDSFADKLSNGSFNPEKKAILQKKDKAARLAQQALSAKEKTDEAGPLSDSKAYSDYFAAPATRYPLSDGCPVFHPMDQVRVFMRDPFDPNKWYHHFCGFVSDMIDTTDENNAKSLTIQVEDPTKLFRYTRIFVNPGILDATKVITENDLKVQSFYSNFLRDHNLPEIFFTLIFGPDKVGSDVFGQKNTVKNSNYSTRIRGIGHFSFEGSGIFMYGPEQDEFRTTQDQGVLTQDGTFVKPKQATKLLEDIKDPIRIDNLSTWQSIIDHQVFQSDLLYMIPDSISETTVKTVIKPQIKNLNRNAEKNILIEEVIKFIGENPQWYPVDGGKLLMLLPNSLGPDNRNIIEKDIIQSYPLNSDWNSAGAIMFKTLARIQFSMQCSPRGDIIVEFPLFDFDPDDFGSKEIPPQQLAEDMQRLVNAYNQSKKKSTPHVLLDALKSLSSELEAPNSEARGPYDKRYIIYKDDTVRVESSLIDEKVFTMGQGSPNIIQNWDGIGTTAVIGQVVTVTLSDLIPLYGIRSIPIVEKGSIPDEVGMRYHINTWLNRMNADAHIMKVDHMPMLHLWLNRPVYIQTRNCIATVRSIAHSLSWPTDMTTSTELYATRVWDGTMSGPNNDIPVFTPLGGAGSRPLNYSMLHNKFKKKNDGPRSGSILKSVGELNNF